MSNIQLTIPGFSPDLVAFKNDLISKENNNVVINSNLDVWQRGTTFSSLANGGFTADRFRLWHNGTGTRTVTRQSFSSASDRIAAITYGHPTNYLRYTKNTTGTGSAIPGYTGSLTPGTMDAIHTPVENVFILSGTVIASAWVRASANCSIYFYLNQFHLGTGPATERYYYQPGLGSVLGASINWANAPIINLVANQWTQISFSCVLDSNIGLSDVLASSSATGGVSVNIAMPNTTGVNIDMTSVSLEKGSTITQKIPRSLYQEVLACQRYFAKSYDLDTVPGTATLIGEYLSYAADTVTTTQLSIVNYPTVMRVAPTVTCYNPFTGAAGSGRRSTSTDVAFSGAFENGQSRARFQFASTTATTVWVSWHYTADADFI